MIIFGQLSKYPEPFEPDPQSAIKYLNNLKIKPLTVEEAKELTSEYHSNEYLRVKSALKVIKRAAKNGFSHCIITFPNVFVGLEVTHILLDLGYDSVYLKSNDDDAIFKISW